MNPIKIYALCDPASGELRYVGKTSNLDRRLKDHWRGKADCHRQKWINSVLKTGNTPDVYILESDSDYWQADEIFWIQYLRSIGCRLVNQTAGGGGCTNRVVSEGQKIRTRMSMIGVKHSPERCTKMSLARKGKPFNKTEKYIAAMKAMVGKKQWWNPGGIPLKEETKIKLSRAKKGKFVTYEHRANLSKALTGKKLSVEHKAKVSLFMKENREYMQGRWKMAYNIKHGFFRNQMDYSE